MSSSGRRGMSSGRHHQMWQEIRTSPRSLSFVHSLDLRAGWQQGVDGGVPWAPSPQAFMGLPLARWDRLLHMGAAMSGRILDPRSGEPAQQQHVGP